MSDALTCQLDALSGSHVSLREAQAVAADLGHPRTRECTTTGALLDEDRAVVLHPEDTGDFDLDALRSKLEGRAAIGTRSDTPS